MKAELDSADVQRCRVFADEVISTNKDHYAKRGQNKTERIKAQIIEGKKAEIGVHAILCAHYAQLSPPDFQVYGKRGKSYDPDLTSDSFDFHIKTQSREQEKEFGASWIFQRNDPLVATPNSRDVLVLTTVDDHLVEVRGIQKARVVAGCYEPLAVSFLNRTKCALYLDTLRREDLV